MQETGVQSLGWEDLLQKGMVTHSQYSCLENSTDRGAYWATVPGVTDSQIELINTFSFPNLILHIV